MTHRPVVLLTGPYGGDVRCIGDDRIEADYPHAFITVLLLFPTLGIGFGSLAVVVGSAIEGSFALFAGSFLGMAYAGFLGWVALRRWRTMGGFALDRTEGVLTRTRRGRVLETVPLHTVVRVGASWDFLHRGFSRVYWVFVELPDGRKLRIGKGEAGEVDRVLGLLAQWGLPVER
jgi:hypothetical protein